jgi:hypothetical protein
MVYVIYFMIKIRKKNISLYIRNDIETLSVNKILSMFINNK